MNIVIVHLSDWMRGKTAVSPNLHPAAQSWMTGVDDYGRFRHHRKGMNPLATKAKPFQG